MRRALLAAAVVLAGCGGTAHSRSPTTANRPPTTAAKPKPTPKPPPVRHGPRRTAVPILMYHLVNTPPPGVPNAQLWVPAAAFRAQVQALARAGYHGVTLDQVLANWQRRIALPAKPVVFSFDDGYGSQERNAMPILRRHDWPGVLYLEVKNLSIAGGITKREVRRLMQAGWEIDAHTITHPDLTTLDAASLRHEVSGSRAALRHDFAVPVDNFAYPAGAHDPAAEAAVRAAGYRTAVTTAYGLAHMDGDHMTLPRVRVNGTDSAVAVLQAVESAQ